MRKIQPASCSRSSPRSPQASIQRLTITQGQHSWYLLHNVLGSSQLMNVTLCPRTMLIKECHITPNSYDTSAQYEVGKRQPVSPSLCFQNVKLIFMSGAGNACCCFPLESENITFLLFISLFRGREGMKVENNNAALGNLK